MTRRSVFKDLGRNGQKRAITSEAAYTPTSKRADSRSVNCSIFNLPFKMLRC
ncbi:acetyltransferase [Lacticaseibacillus rhamnosus]|nr:acetyltransferase [Lacticaseibacillus rhamnosus]